MRRELKRRGFDLDQSLPWQVGSGTKRPSALSSPNTTISTNQTGSRARIKLAAALGKS